MNPQTLRILDANANRAREALRVLEDYTRFVLNSESLSAELKSLRHDLTQALAAFLPEAILHRDTPDDVGTSIKTPAELRRDDLNHVVTAAGKRLGEALRTLEEYLKTANAGVDSSRFPSPGTPGEGRGEGLQEYQEKGSNSASAQVESIRYRFYEIEKTIALTLRPRNRFENVRLYVLITESICRIPWLEAARQAIAGGADCLQLREKSLESGELLTRARALVALCRQHNAISIINDRPDIALLANADGLHVGQTDLPAREARKIIGPDKLLGVSTHNLDQAKQAVLDSADYIGVGPFFKSPTKPRDFVAGPEYARQIVHNIPIPAVAIAGITQQNLDQVLATGINAIAVTAAVLDCQDIRAGAQRLKNKLVQ